MNILIPHDLSPRSIASFALELNNVPDAEEYTFDFGGQRWFPPFSMLLLSSILRQFKSRHPNARRRSHNHDNHQYAAHFGFFRSFGLAHGNDPGEALGSSRYLPISELNVREVRTVAISTFREVGDVLESKSSDLASILTLHQQDQLHETLAYSMREIIRNVVEHSGSETIYYCAQYWPTRHQVEVGIADDGIGIRASLARNPPFSDIGEEDAVQLVLLPGISGNPLAGKRNNVWNNSGYGLYMTNRICRRGGQFLLISGGHGVELDSVSKTSFRTDICGTAIRMLIDTADLRALNEQLRRFAEEGRAAARTISGANTNLASAASQMLSRDFRIE